MQELTTPRATPKRSKARGASLSFWLDPEIVEKIDSLAEERDLNRSDIMRLAVKQFIERQAIS